MSPRQIAEAAFRLHEEGHLTREELVSILEQCVNATALENGYADMHGLPFPTHEAGRSYCVPSESQQEARFTAQLTAEIAAARSSTEDA